jgi:glycosyltransferase involved in cell wall biosynthesis
MSQRPAGSAIRIAWMEEWMSTLAREVLPELSRRHRITYVTAGDETPEADFDRVVRCPRRKHMNLSGFGMSSAVNRLHRDGLVDMAMVWASIGFGLRGVPFINLEGTSVYAEIGLFASRSPFHHRPKFLPGLIHYALPEILCNRRAESVIVPSAALKRDIVRLHRVPEARVVVVPHGVEPRHLACYPKKSPSARPSILFVGRLHFRKGIAPVLEEFVRRRDIDADFVIAGDGPDRGKMEQIGRGDARVKLLGAIDRDDLESLLLRTRVFALPTFYEGFGLSLLEAMASGHACVCYDLPVVREVLGDEGVLVSLGDVPAFVDALGRMVLDEKAIASCAARAHKRAAEFTWHDAVAAIDRVIHDTAAGLRSTGKVA